MLSWQYQNYKERGNQSPPCDYENFCIVTKMPPTDESDPMETSWPVDYIANAWEEIISLGKRQERTIEKNKKLYTINLPTLEKVEVWMENELWHLAPIEKCDFLYFLSIFHNAFISIKLR